MHDLEAFESAFKKHAHIRLELETAVESEYIQKLTFMCGVEKQHRNKKLYEERKAADNQKKKQGKEVKEKEEEEEEEEDDEEEVPVPDGSDGTGGTECPNVQVLAPQERVRLALDHLQPTFISKHQHRLQQTFIGMRTHQ